MTTKHPDDMVATPREQADAYIADLIADTPAEQAAHAIRDSYNRHGVAFALYLAHQRLTQNQTDHPDKSHGASYGARGDGDSSRLHVGALEAAFLESYLGTFTTVDALLEVVQTSTDPSTRTPHEMASSWAALQQRFTVTALANGDQISSGAGIYIFRKQRP